MTKISEDKTLDNRISTFEINTRPVGFLEALVPKYKPVDSMNKFSLQMSQDAGCWCSSKLITICFNDSVVELDYRENQTPEMIQSLTKGIYANESRFAV